MGSIKVKNQSQPLQPVAGYTEVYIDSADKLLKTIDENGLVKILGNASNLNSIPVDNSGINDNFILVYNQSLNKLEYRLVDAINIKGVSVDDAAKADDYVLAFNSVSGSLEYKPRVLLESLKIDRIINKSIILNSGESLLQRDVEIVSGVDIDINIGGEFFIL